MSKTQITFLVALLVSISAAGCLGTSSDSGTTGTTGTTGGTGTGGTGGTTKAFASVWSITNSAWTMDLTGARVDGVQFNATYTQGGNTCICPMTFTGTTSSGTCTALACSPSTGTCGSDPGGPASFCPNHAYTWDGTYFQFTNGGTYH
jgi:hypothetical protein